MLTLSAEQVRDRLPWDRLIAALERQFAAGCFAPPRHAHAVEWNGDPVGSLLLMPAWDGAEALGVKIVTVFPGNAARDLPAVSAVYLLFDGATGRLRAVVDGEELTARRTAATSALVAARVARVDAETFLMVGTGALAAHLIAAHANVRPYRRLLIWGRRVERARAVIDAVAVAGLTVEFAPDLGAATRIADTISCATLSTAPLIFGADLKEGAHLDLVGAFRPDMREVDGAAVARAGIILVDTRAGAAREAGDLIQAAAEGCFADERITADVGELCRGDWVPARRPDDISLFKSVGAALEDLAAAKLAFEG